MVIGVHSPEFAFEHNVDNVRRQAKDMRVDYPIAIDNDFAIWRALNNNYWPALYLVDAQGRIRYHQFGEGEYDKSERSFNSCCPRREQAALDQELVAVDARGAEVPADWNSLKSQENYVGQERTENFASPGGAVLDKPHAYAAPARLRLNQWALAGDWTVGKGAIALNKANGRIVYRFHARDLHLVMGPATRGTPVRFRVLIDGQPPGASSRDRRRRPRQRHGRRTAAVSTHPANEPDRRSPVRDRVSRSGRGGLCVHLRLTPSATAVVRARTARRTCSGGASRA